MKEVEKKKVLKGEQDENASHGDDGCLLLQGGGTVRSRISRRTLTGGKKDIFFSLPLFTVAVCLFSSL